MPPKQGKQGSPSSACVFKSPCRTRGLLYGPIVAPTPVTGSTNGFSKCAMVKNMASGIVSSIPQRKSYEPYQWRCVDPPVWANLGPNPTFATVVGAMNGRRFLGFTASPHNMGLGFTQILYHFVSFTNGCSKNRAFVRFKHVRYSHIISSHSAPWKYVENAQCLVSMHTEVRIMYQQHNSAHFQGCR